VNSILVPLEITFSFEVKGLEVLDYLMDFIFFLDIIVNFRTIIFDSRTEEPITNFKVIAKHYVITGRFFIDFISTLPIELIAKGFGSKI
jgi:hypothetical protein